MKTLHYWTGGGGAIYIYALCNCACTIGHKDIVRHCVQSFLLQNLNLCARAITKYSFKTKDLFTQRKRPVPVVV
jgi:hypothetical protein